ncbi:hypothetical protein GTY87_28880 [Streptomyces sp. SID7813]|uniref:Uncharacterized protein n=1 Tax=Streptomyces coelicolor (strain ATCC BAA-471 / A3(2) / M145) TaxID=100226 RepID=O86756_STRCO|nr:hypothetical protein [Streptomyces sp. SID7813]QFI45501.1 hypothetical protein FQ762_29160 [Streptomyces coelicolor A3(2)]CAA19909.1 hypothetical protein SC6A9.24 [Streptomyces coelicolor A3(2)]
MALWAYLVPAAGQERAGVGRCGHALGGQPDRPRHGLGPLSAAIVAVSAAGTGAGHVVDTVTCRSADHPYADERPDEGDGCHQFGCPWASAAVGRRWVNHYRATDTRDSGRGHAGRLALCCEKAGRAKGVRRTPTSATLRRSTVLRRHRTGLLDALLPVRCFTVVDSVKTSVLRKS